MNVYNQNHKPTMEMSIIGTTLCNHAEQPRSQATIRTTFDN